MYTIICSTLICTAQDKIPPANYDESKVPSFTLPNPLVTLDGNKVETAKQWNEQRRDEILNLFREHVYGKPALPEPNKDFIKMKTELVESGEAFDGKAMRYQFRLTFSTDKSDDGKTVTVDFIIYTPKPTASNSSQKFPLFISLNFDGNHTINTDPKILVSKSIWARSQNEKPLSKPGNENERGKASKRFPIETLIERGFAIGTAYYCEIEPDFNGGIKYGIRSLLYTSDQNPAANDANALATWAWGMSRLLDVAIENRDKLSIDTKKVAVFGHSRLGKAAVWAGAIDIRFGAVISNDSGCGGAALSRREFGETVQRINTVFPHWFCDNFKKYNTDINACPVDQHELIALIAPRPVYIASANEDQWADPRGEFLSGFYADAVYRLLGTNGFNGVKEMPEPDKSVGGKISYHIRTGKHDILEFDWIQYMNFIERQ
jgi:hypothetical protein